MIMIHLLNFFCNFLNLFVEALTARLYRWIVMGHACGVQPSAVLPIVERPAAAALKAPSIASLSPTSVNYMIASFHSVIMYCRDDWNCRELAL
mmetsp:Transcript_24064/g.37114  ORF Transcript_24064/g.37114 Transcript_24064/m.37114 type:complete len:93 (-) Transcript_24064:41-319(-)